MASLNIEYLFLKIYDLFHKGEKVVVNTDPSGFKIFIVTLFSLISIAFIAVIIYSMVRLKERRAADHHKLHLAVHSASHHKKEEKENKRWKMVLDFITSDSPSDWRIAVIEADNILDDLTKELGLVGDNLGERLKNASVSHFKTLDNAWEAHKTRNKIAHEGMAYEISYREAKKAIELYESVFNEFEYL